MRPLLQNEKS